MTTINPSVQVQGPYTGSSSSTAKLPFTGKLSLRDAIQRGLNFNLGATNLNRTVLQAQGQSEIARSALLPNVSGYLAESLQQANLAAEGLRIHIPIPGFNFPTIVGPYNNIDLRGSVSQSVLDLTAWNNFRASSESVHAAQLSARDARRRRRPRGLRRLSPDHRHQGARRIRPSAARHRQPLYSSRRSRSVLSASRPRLTWIAAR